MCGHFFSKGVAILISKDYEAKIINIQRDSEGRILVIDVERQGSSDGDTLQNIHFNVFAIVMYFMHCENNTGTIELIKIKKYKF